MDRKNPFITSGYEGPEYFCDREAETKALLDGLANGRNITLIAPRRLGKTGLIQNAFHSLRRSGAAVPVYVDIYDRLLSWWLKTR